MQGIIKKGGGQFVDRGDPAAADYTEVVLTIDEAWHDLDLSALVPVGAKAVLLKITIRDNSAGFVIMLRKKGNINIFNISQLETQGADIFIHGDYIVACDANREIQYNIETGMDMASLTVGGWWL